MLNSSEIFKKSKMQNFRFKARKEVGMINHTDHFAKIDCRRKNVKKVDLERGFLKKRYGKI